MQSKFRRRLATSPAGPVAALPLRTMQVARHDAERTGRRYLFLREQPAGHWWPGDGIAAWAKL